MHDYKRPPTLHRYGQRSELELALSLGQFRLAPAGNCLTLTFRSVGQPVRPVRPGRRLFDHQYGKFGNAHRAVPRTLPTGQHRWPRRIRQRAALCAAFTNAAESPSKNGCSPALDAAAGDEPAP